MVIRLTSSHELPLPLPLPASGCGCNVFAPVPGSDRLRVGDDALLGVGVPVTRADESSGLA